VANVQQEVQKMGSQEVGEPLSPQGATAPSPVQAKTEAPAQAIAAEPLPEGMRPSSDGKGIQVLSTAAYKRLKDEARERGKKEARAELLKSLGYDTEEALREATQAKPKAKEPPRETESEQGKTPDQRSQSKSYRALQRERDKLSSELTEAKEQLQRMTSQVRKLREDGDRREAEVVLREAAIRSGIRDVNYAIHLAHDDLAGKNEADLEKFDEHAYFSGLREKHPYLFGETIRPATTGTGANAAPPAPKAGEATQAAATNNRQDARSLDQKAFADLLRQKGLTPNI